MMSAVRAQHNSLCPECKNPIQKGDAIVVVDDKWMHVECECDFRPWDEPTYTPPQIHRLLELANLHGTFAGRLFDADFQPDDLPDAVAEVLWTYIIAESALWHLLRDLSAEHSVVE